MAWTADQAIFIGRKFEPYDVFWLEEPVNCEDFDGYFLVAEKLNIRIVGGETNFTRFDFRPFFRTPRIPIFMPDVMRGGLTGMRKIATVADTWGMTISPHLFPELMVQVMASIPNGLVLEYLDFLDDLWVDPVLPKNGMMSPLGESLGTAFPLKKGFLRRPDFGVIRGRQTAYSEGNMIEEFGGDLFQWLRGFYFVARTGSVTRAAEAMRRNQPASATRSSVWKRRLGFLSSSGLGEKWS